MKYTWLYLPSSIFNILTSVSKAYYFKENYKIQNNISCDVSTIFSWLENSKGLGVFSFNFPKLSNQCLCHCSKSGKFTPSSFFYSIFSINLVISMTVPRNGTNKITHVFFWFLPVSSIRQAFHYFYSHDRNGSQCSKVETNYYLYP